jgi:hypothetical protein
MFLNAYGISVNYRQGRSEGQQISKRGAGFAFGSFQNCE